MLGVVAKWLPMNANILGSSLGSAPDSGVLLMDPLGGSSRCSSTQVPAGHVGDMEILAIWPML